MSNKYNHAKTKCLDNVFCWVFIIVIIIVQWLVLNLLTYWAQHFNSIVFKDFLNSSAGIPSPPLALFVVMLPKAHLTSHSRMSGHKWMTTEFSKYDHWPSQWPLCLSVSLRPFLYSSSVSSWHFLISSASVKSLQFLSFIVYLSLHEMVPWYLQFSWRDLSVQFSSVAQ